MTARRMFARRHVVVAALAAGATAPGWWRLRSWLVLGDERARAAALVAAVFADPASARAVGRAYLAVAGPAEQRPGDLLRAIFAASPADDRRRAPPVSGVAAQIRRDFAARAVVNLDGWILCRTEARLCALAALVT